MIQEFNGVQIRTRGRTIVDGNMLFLTFPLSEAGFRVTGATGVQLVLRADDTPERPECAHQLPRFGIWLDDELILDQRMQERETVASVFQGAPRHDARIRLVKLSECTQSLMALKGIITDGAVHPLSENGEGKIEFIGDSITCGYGVESHDESEPFSTETENAGKGYAALTAEALGMEPMLTAFSGFGIVSGYTDSPENRNTDMLVPMYYEKYGMNEFVLPSGRRLQDISWDFSAWEPDRILIQLGTNDLSWCQENSDRKDLYQKLYIDFLKMVRKNNPKAGILCVLGVMGTGLNQAMCNAVREYRGETGDTRIHAFAMDEQDGKNDGFGANWHPSALTQRKLADRIVLALRNT